LDRIYISHKRNCTYDTLVQVTATGTRSGFTAKPQTMQWNGGEIWRPYKT